MKDYGSENNRGYRYLLAVFDRFSKRGWTAPLKNENAQTKTDSLENVLITSTRKPKLFETERGKDFYNSIFQSFLNNNNIKV